MTSSALAETPAGLWVPPRFVTPRDPRRRTVGAGVAKVARALGTPLMPWQRYVADVMGEVDDHDVLIHPFGVVSVQRQAGKTQLDLAQSVHRCLWKPRARVWHTAQTGQDAAEKWWELVEAVLDSPLRELIKGKPRKSAGSQALEFINGSKLRPHPPTRDGIHGKQVDLSNVDEGWSFEDDRGAELLQAIIPAQATRPGAQTIVWSTMGDAKSTWFHGLADAAEEGTAPIEGVPPPAGFIWGIPDADSPDAVDPDDIEGVARYHPAVGHTQTVDSLRRARATPGMTRDEFARAYGNRRTGGRTRVISEAAWSAARTWEDLSGRPAYGVGVWEPRTGGSVMGALVAASLSADGVPVVEVIEHRPGRAWLTERVKGLQTRGQGVAVDRSGPAGPVADQLELAGVELLPLSGLDKAAACQDFWDRVADADALEQGPRLLHRAEHEPDADGKVTPSRIDASVDVAGRRFIGEGAWVWSAKASQGDVAVLEAATLAVRALSHTPAPVAVGRTVFA